MRLEDNEPVPGEPEDGWEKAPDLQTSELLSVTLCKYTGFIVDDLEAPCQWADTHAPGPCYALYHSAAALMRGEIDIANYPADVLITEVRANAAGDPNAKISG